MNAALRGFQLVFSRRELWPYIYKPWIVSGIIFLLILVSGFAFFVPLAGNIAENSGISRGVGTFVGTAFIAFLWWFTAGIVYLAITGILSSFLWDGLSKKIEELEAGMIPTRVPHAAWQIYDTVIRLPFSVFVVLASLIFGWLFFGLVGIALAGWLGIYDYTACAYIRRNVLFGRQFFRVWRAPGALGFAAISGLITLLPFVNVLCLPALVAGGTILALQDERMQGVK